MGQASQSVGKHVVWAAGRWVEALCACATCAVAITRNYQAMPCYPDDQTCYLGVENVESRLRQHQSKVS